MKQFSNYDEAKKQAQAGPSEKLPAGAYVCKIMAVRYTKGQDGKSDKIDLQIDVLEGPKKDFFRKQYEENTREDKKWKGKATIYVPSDDGSEKDGWTKKTFAGWTDSIEQSNPGYTWDWDEKKWKGKTVGIVFGETGSVIEGREVTFTEPRFAVAAQLVREGKAPEAKFKSKNGYGKRGAAGSSSGSVSDDTEGFMTIADGVDDIPFD